MSEIKGRRSYQRVVYFNQSSREESSSASSRDSESSSPGKSNNLSALKKSSQSPSKSPNSKQPKASSKKLPQNESKKDTNSNEKKMTLIVVFGIVLAILYYRNRKISAIKVEQKTCPFDDIEMQYPDQKTNLFKSLQTEIEDILKIESENLAVFLFLHNNSSFTNTLIDDILKKTANCLDAIQETDILRLTKEDFTSEKATKDYGHVIEKYKQSMKDVLFVVNLNQIPGMTARALHSICDTQTPIKSRVIIFLTLITKKHKVDKPTVVAYSTLFDLWGSQIERNELDALITRVTDHVFFLKDKKII